jgi:hypothetical protein
MPKSQEPRRVRIRARVFEVSRYQASVLCENGADISFVHGATNGIPARFRFRGMTGWVEWIDWAENPGQPTIQLPFFSPDQGKE